MKKWFLLTIMLGAFAINGQAQDDDMYFVPTKNNVAREKSSYGIPTDTYYSGSSRTVDEYNRRWNSSYEVLPADTGDIISFAGVEGIYPDSLGDFSLTQRMARWDGYEPSGSYWAGYADGRYDSWGWHSPWYYSYYYWDPWYWDSWYWDPWYYSSWSPWYWGWGGYYGARYYSPWRYYGWGGGGVLVSSRNYPGTQNHGRITGSANRGFASGRTRSFSSGTFGSNRTLGSAGFGGSNGGTRTGTTTTRTRTPVSGGTFSNSNGNFGGNSGGYTPSRSSGGGFSGGSSGGGSSSGSFGGSSSGGGGGGGSRSGGGGGFGGGRR